MQYDVFISHASIDKEAVARPLSEALQARGLSVWLDEEQLHIGDSIRRGIDQALAQSRFGVVILSPAYLASEWTRKELDALFTKEKHQNKTILPVSHQLEREDIEAFSPMLADKITLSVDEGIEVLADRLQESVQALPKAQQAAIINGWRLKFPTANWQWFIATVVALSAIAVPVWMSIYGAPTDSQKTVNINVSENHSPISVDTFHGDKVLGDKIETTVIYQNPDAEELAKQLVTKMSLATTADLQVKNEEIKRLTETITRLQQAPGDEHKQSALQKLQDAKPQEATALLKQSIAERSKAREVLAKKEAQDWVDVGNIAFFTDPQEALAAYKHAVELDNSNIEAWRQLGRIQHFQGKLKQAEIAYQQVLTLAGNNKIQQAATYTALGSISYQLRKDLDALEKYNLQALKISKALDNKHGMSTNYSNLGRVYKIRNDLSKAADYYQQAIDIAPNNGRDRPHMSIDYYMLGNIYKDIGDLDSACETWKGMIHFLSETGHAFIAGDPQPLINENC